MRIGIIGQGFVGTAVRVGLQKYFTILTYDKNGECSNTLEEVVERCKIIFLCLPTPMVKETGKCYTGILEKVLDQINDISDEKEYYDNEQRSIVIKSTIEPGTTEKFNKKYKYIQVVFNPEFLTERTAKLDFLTQARIILGGTKRLTKRVAKIFEERFMHTYIIETDTITAEMVKYMNNVFFASKVSIMNEMKMMCDAVGGNWEQALKGFASDQRIGDSHLHVPGPDGKMGFGGSCFPKDINAFISYANQLGVKVPTIEGAWETNLNVRPERDWEKLEGRAIIKSN